MNAGIKTGRLVVLLCPRLSCHGWEMIQAMDCFQQMQYYQDDKAVWNGQFVWRTDQTMEPSFKLQSASCRKEACHKIIKLCCYARTVCNYKLSSHCCDSWSNHFSSRQNSMNFEPAAFNSIMPYWFHGLND